MCSELESHRVKCAFVYPGTSELSLCASINDSTIILINSRGDREAVFISAGYNYFDDFSSVCVLHGARGLTNAIGAIGVANRNEIPLMVIVGMPSRSSQKYLPPHGEKDLLNSVSGLVKATYELNFDAKKENQYTYFLSIKEAFDQYADRPYGPVVLGIQQELFEKKWIHVNGYSQKENKDDKINANDEVLKIATNVIKKSKKPIILIDDFCFSYPDIECLIKEFSERLSCSVYQVCYKRGPMLFKMLTNRKCPNFMGCIDIANLNYISAIKKTDLIITIEDRNMYPRVIGALPKCQKVALTSNPTKVVKNGYINNKDLLVVGNVSYMLRSMIDDMSNSSVSGVSNSDAIFKNDLHHYRVNIVKELSDYLSGLENPVIVDDSQAFGGLISECYYLLPDNVKIFGDHSAFIGAGISHSIGVSLSYQKEHVLCLLGDQGFINGIQGLIAAIELDVKIIFVVCDNSGSFTLKKQLSTLSNSSSDYLNNNDFLSYSKISDALGIQSIELKYKKNNLGLFDALVFLKKKTNIGLIHLRLPANKQFWTGIWNTKGYDE